jgi:hypothetical protein
MMVHSEFIMCRYFSYKIRFEALKRQQDKERDKPKMLQNNLTINLLNIG